MHIQESIYHKIFQIAENDDRIRAVLLNGSRANPNIEPDKYQDYDLLLVVSDFETFIEDKSWILQFGKPILQQLPDEMLLGSDADTKRVTFTIMTFFEEGYRIDLTFFPVEKIETDYLHDSLTVVWVDKDGLFTAFPKASDKDYYVLKPDQRAFQEVCNEFWWTITNVAKGLKRGEIIYAKDMMENVVRPVFLQMIYWKIGLENDFQISVGKSGKFISKVTSDTLYAKILKTYSDADIKSNWNALFLMVSIFESIQIQLAQSMHFYLNADESANSKRYIENLYKE